MNASLTPGVAYCDSSALVKVVRTEVESTALTNLLAEFQGRSSSALAVVEVGRAVTRADPSEELEQKTRRVLAGLHLVPLTRGLLDFAAAIKPRSLRSLDAIHLASALSLGDRLAVFIAYDRVLIEAAMAVGLKVLSPA